MSAFLEDADIAKLTGRKMKSLQIVALRKMGIVFRVNATGHPVVTWSAVEGRKEEPVKTAWQPRLLKGA